uniref:SET domain-containing protein n=1 Tax=Syphacia muris TaxID=451379 RepID=A0A0N5A8I0_9BILA
MLKSIRRQQLSAMHHRDTYAEQRKRPTFHVRSLSASECGTNNQHISLKDAVDYPSTKSGGHRLPHPLGGTSDGPQDVIRNRTDEKRWRRRMRVKNTKVNRRSRLNRSSSLEVEKPRDADLAGVGFMTHTPTQNWLTKQMEDLADFVYEEPHAQVYSARQLTDVNQCNTKYEELKKTRFKYFMTRRTIDKQPEVILNEAAIAADKANGNYEFSKLDATSPGAYSLYVQDYIAQRKFDERKECADVPINSEMITEQPSAVDKKKIFSFEKEDIEKLINRSRKDDILSLALLYDARYDNNWKRLKNLSSEERRKWKNRCGWVRPLSKLCEKVGIDHKFFSKNPNVSLADARDFILYQRLTAIKGPSEWVMEVPENVHNSAVEKFFESDWDGKAVQRRMVHYLKCTENDRDRMAIDGQYYNNIYLGKRMYGPGRKQKVVRTMIGGMEHRFEVMDSPINRFYFTCDVSLRYPEKCRNKRVKCRDSSRVILNYPENCECDFIHANYVRGGPLFNEFIITQAPMDNTVGDFWRMVWQEQSPYIFMLISRKQKHRCAAYWPRTIGSSMQCYGLKIVNQRVDEYRHPLFRVTSLLIYGPDEKQLKVEHWQGDFNNSDNLAAPLQLLHLARNCSRPTIVHCHLGISRSAVLVAIEICISSILRGPSYNHLVQKAVQLLRTQRPYSIETPMQYIYIHRVLQYFMQPFVGDLYEFRYEYKHWLDERAQRSFLDEIGQQVPGYRCLSPPVDADLIGRTRHSDVQDHFREVSDSVGQLPIPLEQTRNFNDELRLSKKYPRGLRYE